MDERSEIREDFEVKGLRRGRHISRVVGSISNPIIKGNAAPTPPRHIPRLACGSYLS